MSEQSFDILDDIEHLRTCLIGGCRRCFPIDPATGAPCGMSARFQPRLIEALRLARAELFELRRLVERAPSQLLGLRDRLATQGVSIKNLLRDVDQLRAERDRAWQELSDARARLEAQDKEHAEVGHLTQLAALAAPAIRKLQRLHDQVHGPRGLKFLVDRLLRYVRHNFDCVAVGSTLPCDCGCASVRAYVTALLGDAVPFLDQPADDGAAQNSCSEEKR